TLGCTGKDTRIIAVSAKRSQANKIKDLCYTKINTEITQLKNNISGNSSLNITDIDNKITQLRDELDARIHNDWVMNSEKISQIDQRVHNDWIRLKINAISLKTYIGGLIGAERTVADGEFETFDGAWIFVDFTAYISSMGKITVKTFVNDIVQFVQSREFIHNCEETMHFTLPVLSSGDKKRIAVTMEGTAEITDIQAFAWGQGLNGQALNHPENNDFVYINNNGITTVTGYVGHNISPQIPDVLGGGVTTIIEKSAFSGTDVESVYIPYGVTEIR
ncbi:MAG: hypothetical protein K2J08_03855, partial [Ruminococcus sp.]|nr:hypothetical protein [Ruminococcus sp.]